MPALQGGDGEGGDGEGGAEAGRDEITIRPARPRDRDVLAELYAAFVESHAGYGRAFETVPDPAPRLRELFATVADQPDTAVFVAEGAAGPVGFLVASIARRPGFFDETVRGRIEDAYVREELRRSGTGRALVEAATAWMRAQGAQRVILQVARRNEEARAFWDGLGFAPFMDVLERDL